MLSDNIKNLRKAKGLSQEELAIKLNVVRQTVSKWENSISLPDIVTLRKISDLLGIPNSEIIQEIIDGSTERNRLDICHNEENKETLAYSFVLYFDRRERCSYGVLRNG